MRKVEKFLVFMGRGSQVPREKNLSMKKLINIVLNMRNMLKNEVGAEVSQYEGSSKYQYNEVCGTNIKKDVAGGTKVFFRQPSTQISKGRICPEKYKQQPQCG